MRKTIALGNFQLIVYNAFVFLLLLFSRIFTTRAKEHINSITINKITTGKSEHCIDNNHSADENNNNVLHAERNSKNLALFESLELKEPPTTTKTLQIIN